MLETENDLVKVKWNEDGGGVNRVARANARGAMVVRDPVWVWRVRMQVRVGVRRARAEADADEPKGLRRIGLSLEAGVTPGLRTGVRCERGIRRARTTSWQ